MAKCKYIVVEGSIWVGKTNLAKILAGEFSGPASQKVKRAICGKGANNSIVWFKVIVMAKVDYISLQQRYGGRYIARRDEQVIADAASYDELIDNLENAMIDWSKIIIEYVEPANIVCIY
jgi:hypothetical protein